MSLDAWLAERSTARADAGLHRVLRPRGPAERLIDLAGNDYLGLRTSDEVVQAAARAAVTWGTGAGSSRLVTGTLHLHAELEATLASFTGREAALVFSTGYQANLGVVTALSDRQTLIVSDAHVHASLVDACRLARSAETVVVPHNDLDAIQQALQSRSQPRALVLVESVYSVLGDAAPLSDLADLCRRYGAVLVVDEAHAIGVCGRGGRGLVEAQGLSPRRDVVSTMTLSKSLASQGGAVLGSQAVVDHLVNTARPFIYDTGLSPVSTAAALAALRTVEAQPSLPRRTLALAARIADSLVLEAPAGSLLSMPMGSPQAALKAQAELAADGFLVGCFRPPSVPDGVSRLRLTSRSSLSDADVDRVVERLATVATHG